MGIISGKNLFAALCVFAGFSPILFALFDVLFKRHKK